MAKLLEGRECIRPAVLLALTVTLFHRPLALLLLPTRRGPQGQLGRRVVVQKGQGAREEEEEEQAHAQDYKLAHEGLCECLFRCCSQLRFAWRAQLRPRLTALTHAGHRLFSRLRGSVVSSFLLYHGGGNGDGHGDDDDNVFVSENKGMSEREREQVEYYVVSLYKSTTAPAFSCCVLSRGAINSN